MATIAVTVGRIEYIVGADGRVLQKETRDAARAAGKLGGKTYSDEYLAEFRKRWGGASGFQATLGKYDQNVIKQFQNLGGFTSKAFATRFEKTLKPAYQDTAKRMVRFFEQLNFDPLNGITTEMRRLFGATDDVEKSMRGVKGILDELDATRRLGIIDHKELELDIGAVNRLRKAIQETLDTENWELLTDSQRRNRDLLWEQAEAAEAITEQENRRAELLGRTTQSLEQQGYTIERMLADRREFAELTDDESVALIKQLGLWDEMSRAKREQIQLYDDIARQQERFDNIFEASWGRQTKDFSALTAELNRLHPAIEKTGSAARNGGKDVDAFGVALDFLGEKIARFGTRSDLNPRMIAAIVAVLGEPIAVLGGALGPALVVAGAGLGALAVGGAALISTFVTLNKELGELPPSLRDVAREWQGFQRAFGETSVAVAAAAFSEMDGTFDRLSRTLQRMTPYFQEVGIAVGGLIDDFSKAISSGRGFAELTTFAQDSAEVFDRLARVVGDFSLSLLTAFNRANPVTLQFVGYLEDLADSFDGFVTGAGFNEWLEHSVTIFSALNRLLQATGTMLNNLVDDASVARTAAFIDNLAEFAPHLQNVIEVFGELDVLGLVSHALVQVGEALEPLVPIFLELAAALSSQLAGAISVAAGLIAVLAGALATLLENVPPEAILAIATALLALSAASKVSAAVTAITGLGTALAGLAGKMGLVTAATPLAASSLTTLGKAGAIGALAAGVTVGVLALRDLVRELQGIEKAAQAAISTNARITDSYYELGRSTFGVISPLEDVDYALDHLTGDLDSAVGKLGSIGNAFTQGGHQANALSQTLQELDKPLAKLAETDVPAAAEQFSAWAQELGASDAQVKNMLATMPQFAALMDAAGISAHELATGTGLVASATAAAAPQISANVAALESLRRGAELSEEQVSSLADAIRTFGDAQLTTMETNAAFEQSIDDLTASLLENGGTLDLNTQQGRDNQASLIDSVQSAKDHAAAVFEETGSIDIANESLATQKQRLIDTIKEMDSAGYEAGIYSGLIDAIPDDATTIIYADTGPASTAVQNLINSYNNNVITLQVAIARGAADAELAGMVGVGIPSGASGMMLDKGPRMIYAGEAGPEALVPLHRPLSMVDPAVRGLSAIAQGKSVPHYAGGGVVGRPNRVLNISSGAITIQGDRAPEATATHVVNRIAERLA